MKKPAPKVTGVDCKRYNTEPKAAATRPHRAPLTDTAARAGREFRKVVERLERIAQDDRLSANKEEVAAHLSGHLAYAMEVCQDLALLLSAEEHHDLSTDPARGGRRAR